MSLEAAPLTDHGAPNKCDTMRQNETLFPAPRWRER